MKFIAHLLIEDDVNSIDIIRHIFFLEAANPDEAIAHLKKWCLSTVRDDLHITDDSNPGLNQIIASTDCQQFHGGGGDILNLSTNADHEHDSTYRSWSEHL